MEIRNWYLLVGVIITLIAIVPLIVYIIPKQFHEVRRPKNEFTRLRKLVLSGEIFMMLAMIPGVPRSIQVLDIPPANNFAKLVAITNRLPYVAMMVILVLIYNYRDKRD